MCYPSYMDRYLISRANALERILDLPLVQHADVSLSLLFVTASMFMYAILIS